MLENVCEDGQDLNFQILRKNFRIFFLSGSIYSTFFMITRDLILKVTGEYDVAIVCKLRLSHLEIVKIAGLNDLSNLLELNLSSNKIVDIGNLSYNIKLRRLDLSCNSISSIRSDSLCGNKQLEFICLEGNLINKIEDVRKLMGLEKLKSLYLQNCLKDLSNPVCELPNYFSKVADFLNQLNILDGESVQLMLEVGERNDIDNVKADSKYSEELETDDWFNGAVLSEFNGNVEEGIMETDVEVKKTVNVIEGDFKVFAAEMKKVEYLLGKTV